MNSLPPTRCKAWPKLKAHAMRAGAVRPGRRLVARAPGLRLDYSRQRIDRRALALLAQLAAEKDFAGWRAALFAGGKVNTSEGRAAWHTALRAGKDAPPEVKQTLLRIRSLVSRIRNEGRIKRVVNLGTGGSDLGPRLLADAFGDGALDVRFVANADAVELERALAGARPASTLVVVVSKSFTTQETMSNARVARKFLGKHSKNIVAVTADPQAARRFGAGEVLPLWDWVGGRYSVWSAAGFSAACAIGFDRFRAFLSGAREMDGHFLEKPPGRNVPALLALLGIWNVNFLGLHAHAVLPYAHRLRLLPAYLQQLEMESNGKRLDREGRETGYATCPVLFGAEGTPAQHSFMQLLHEGTQAVPADFIDCGVNGILSAHAAAQARALALRNRPSSTLHVSALNARNLGRLLALYEHKVFTQGVLWNLNSFDQPGVELGKRLAARILKGER